MWGQHSFLDKKATLKLNVSDIFNTMRFDEVVAFANMNYRTQRRWESRVARLTFSYRFGNKELKPDRRRRTGSEEEQRRLGGN